MKLSIYSSDLNQYLNCDKVINYNEDSIINLANSLYNNSSSNLDYIKKAYEYVRDCISHSADIGEETVTCTASEVLKAGHGICFAKSHLLAALLRCKFIPCGFCYQKLILDDETAPILIYHGLNGVYISEFNKWIRLDARGNKEGVNALFSIEEEHLAFSIRADKGEVDGFNIYPNPDKNVIKILQNSKTRTKLFKNLPIELDYHK